VIGLAPACLGAARRRLLDLGFVPGTVVGVEFVSPVGDPTAYRVRGSVIALRRKQADQVRISTRQEAAT
jgi:DtxR family Mn-dependent transcriptional regulator